MPHAPALPPFVVHMSAAPLVTPELQALLDMNVPYLVLGEDGRVKCELNGHTLPPRADAVAAFVKCAKGGRVD